jgi:2-phospho-L-lactate transferase/gluconeogenesis factor (CofD/UPF0052 family)
VADHVRAIHEHTRARVVDWVVINRAPISPRLLRRYRAQGAEPVRFDLAELHKLGMKVVLDDLVDEDGVVRHHAPRLTRLLLEEFIQRPAPYGAGQRRR